MYKTHYLEHCRPLFKESKILTVYAEFILTSLLYIHNNINAFETNSTYHSYHTRNKEDLLIPLHRIKKTQHSTNHLAIKLYNHLPHRIKCLNTRNFKSTVKHILQESPLYSIEEYFNLNIN